jgi:hypothetical protein
MARWLGHLQRVFAFGTVLFANEHQQKTPYLLAIFLADLLPPHSSNYLSRA